jgi:hypothetical protein
MFTPSPQQNTATKHQAIVTGQKWASKINSYYFFRRKKLPDLDFDLFLHELLENFNIETINDTSFFK